MLDLVEQCNCIIDNARVAIRPTYRKDSRKPPPLPCVCAECKQGTCTTTVVNRIICREKPKEGKGGEPPTILCLVLQVSKIDTLDWVEHCALLYPTYFRLPVGNRIEYLQRALTWFYAGMPQLPDIWGFPSRAWLGKPMAEDAASYCHISKFFMGIDRTITDQIRY